MKSLFIVTTVPQSLGFMLDHVTKFKDDYEITCISSPNDDKCKLKDVAHSADIRTLPLPMERRISPLKDIKSLWQMCRLLHKEKPDIVHSLTPKAGLVTMMAAWLVRIPIRIHTFTGLVFPTSKGIKRRILMFTDRMTCACATHIIPEGEGVKNDLLNNHITRKPIHVLGFGNVRGIDLEHYNPELFNGKKDDGIFRFIFVGRIVGDKGINELVRAFHKLNKANPNTKLILIGPEEDNLDPIKPEIKSEIEDNSSIEALGSQNDVRPFYGEADALVFPSYREGFPNVVIEAGAMGLPSIVTDINGSREIIIDGENGTIVPPHDVDALYKAMKHFVDSPKEVERMAANARPLIASRYERNYVCRCLKDFYKEVITQKNV